jgi:hypothetical protein
MHSRIQISCGREREGFLVRDQEAITVSRRFASVGLFLLVAALLSVGPFFRIFRFVFVFVFIPTSAHLRIHVHRFVWRLSLQNKFN